MKYFAGLDVSLEETAICVVDEAGAIVKETRRVDSPRIPPRSSIRAFRPMVGGLRSPLLMKKTPMSMWFPSTAERRDA